MDDDDTDDGDGEVAWRILLFSSSPPPEEITYRHMYLLTRRHIIPKTCTRRLHIFFSEIFIFK